MSGKAKKNEIIIPEGSQRYTIKEWLRKNFDEVKRIAGPSFTITAVEKKDPQLAKKIDNYIVLIDDEIKTIREARSGRERSSHINKLKWLMSKFKGTIRQAKRKYGIGGWA